MSFLERVVHHLCFLWLLLLWVLGAAAVAAGLATLALLLLGPP